MTSQEELKKVNSDIELLEAELASNVEEMVRIVSVPYSTKRGVYIRLRNIRLEETLKELWEKKKSLTNHIDWERRVS